MSNEGRIVVLMYHGFDSDEKPSELDKKEIGRASCRERV